MTLGQSLWVGASDDLVLSSLDARLAQGGFWGKATLDALDVRTGVVWTGDQQLLVGRADLKVDVKRLHFLSTKGATNGAYLGANKSVETVTVPAPPALGSRRLDVLWVAQRDKKATVSADPATLAEFGVTAGSAGSSPTKPAVPAGTEEVGTIAWDSTTTVASGTNAAQCTLATTCRWVVPTGCAVPVRNQTERDTLPTFAGARALRLDADGAIDVHTGSAWRSSVWQDFNPVLYGGMTGTPVAIGATLNFARFRYLDAHTVQAKVEISRVAGGTITDGLGVSLPVTALRRELNCGTLVVAGATAPTNQSNRAYMSPDRTKLIPVSYTNGYLSVDPNMAIQYTVQYEV